MLIIELIVICVLFWGICYLGTGSDEKNIKSYSSYPNEVQKLVSENPCLSGRIKIINSATSFFSNMVVFGIVLFIFGFFIRQKSFMSNFVNLSILGQSLNLFDFLIIDMLWWRNTKRIRFAGTEEKSYLYKNPKKHFYIFHKGNRCVSVDCGDRRSFTISYLRKGMKLVRSKTLAEGFDCCDFRYSYRD